MSFFMSYDSGNKKEDPSRSFAINVIEHYEDLLSKLEVIYESDEREEYEEDSGEEPANLFGSAYYSLEDGITEKTLEAINNPENENNLGQVLLEIVLKEIDILEAEYNNRISVKAKGEMIDDIKKEIEEFLDYLKD